MASHDEGDRARVARPTGRAAGALADGGDPAPGVAPGADRTDQGDGSEEGDFDPRLGRFVEEVTRRVQAGEPVDLESFSAIDPAWRDEARRLIPALRGLAELRRGAGEGEGSLPSAGGLDEAGRRVLGDFHIVREIGRGGMGVVYEAEQAPLGRPVALKVLLAAVSMDRRAVQRFQLEAQVAGLLQHPRIVPVHAVGSISQVPYLAMRLIEGGSLADLASELRGLAGDGPERSPGRDPALSTLALGLLSGRLPAARGDRVAAPPGVEGRHLAPGPAPTVRTRAFARAIARLGIQAAEALGHAHERGVTHRDVKPANLLLDDKGDLWVADFGMAGVQGDSGLTETGDLPGTLRYMSPEQALGRRGLVDHRTDIYALGVTLYELLALRPAIIGSDRQEILRQIAEGEPTPLRRLNPAVPTDLATIVSKAAAKDPAARYATAAHLAEDLARFLEGRPIAARPVGPAGRAWRWCRRRPWQAGLSAALGLSLLGGLVGVAWGWGVAVRQGRLLASSEAQTRREAAKVAAINRFLVDRLLGQASPETNPEAGRVTLLEVLDRAAAEVATSFAGEPEIEAAVRLAVGRAYHGLGEYPKAEIHLRAAYQILAGRGAGDDPDRLEAEAEFGHILCHLGRPAEAEPRLRHAVERSREVLGPGQRVALRAAEAFAEFLTDAGRYDEAERLYRLYGAEARQAPVPDPEVILTAQNNLGELLGRLGRLDEAEGLLRLALGESTRVRGADNPGTCSILNNLAIALEKQGKDREAERLFREGLGRQDRVLGPHHPATLTIQYNLAHVLEKLGRPDEAERLFRTNVAAQRLANGPEHPSTLYVTSGLAAFLLAQRRLDEAEGLLRPCLDLQGRVLGADHPATRQTARRLERLLKARRDPGTAPGATPEG